MSQPSATEVILHNIMKFVCVILFKTSGKCQMSKTIDKIYIVYLIYDKTD